MKKSCTYLFITVCIMHGHLNLHAQVKDTLAAVKLFSKKQQDIATSPVPVQQLNKTALSKLNSLSVADAVKYFSGVVVKDYGGIGGLKTISVRSLGANHTGVMYDGMIVPDAQGGQIDLGRFSLDNIEAIQLFNNQPADILLPARTYASASVIALSSASLINDPSVKTDIAGKLRFGSFGFINPSLCFKNRIGKHITQSINGEYQYAKGDYSFIDYETGQSKKKRTNSDIRSYRLEYDAVYTVNDSNQLRFKAYYYDSKRGLPGTVILYNNTSDERLDNKSFFAQLSWKKNISRRSNILISTRYAIDDKYYLDPSYFNSAGKLENKFKQWEFYISGAYSYKITPSIQLAYAFDYFKDSLHRFDTFALNFASPLRNNVLNNLALQWKQQRFEVDGNLLFTYISEKVDHGPKPKDLNEFTPAFSASVQPIKNFPLRIRASYKNIFRAPTFDDLYYTNIGNTNLRPEYAKQYDLGITISRQPGRFIKNFVITSDAYYNKVTDKILAVPRQNLFQWTMLNIATADIRGLDVALHLGLEPIGAFEISSRFSYGFQKAVDVSDPASPSYNNQLPYTPEHSGSANVNVLYKQLAFSYNVILSSSRYRLGDQVKENLVKGWTTHDIAISYTIASKKYVGYKLLFEANNVYNRQYEIIKYYPMPRFNYRMGITVTYKKNK